MEKWQPSLARYKTVTFPLGRGEVGEIGTRGEGGGADGDGQSIALIQFNS